LREKSAQELNPFCANPGMPVVSLTGQALPYAANSF